MVKIKTVVALAAEMLGAKERIDRYLGNSANDDDRRLGDALLRCYHLVETEIATDRVPIIMEDVLEMEDGSIPYTELSATPAFILSVCDAFGNPADVKIGVEAIEGENGRYVVRYAKLPSEKSIEGYCELPPNVSSRTLAYGVAAEYCLHTGAYAEYAVWEKRYKEGLTVDSRSRRGKVIKGRAWV
jgi:hypothetical protein